MMSKLSLISLFLLFVDNTSGTSPPPLTSSSMAVSDAKTSLSSQTSPHSKTTWNPKTTKKTAVTSKIAVTAKIAVTSKIMTSKNTATLNIMAETSGGTTLNPMDNIHFLFYVIFLLFCVQSGWSRLELFTFLSQFFIICWMTTSTLGKSIYFNLFPRKVSLV